MEVAAVIPKTSGLSNNEITELLYKIDPNNSDVEVENDDSEADIRAPEPNELLDDLREDEDNDVPEGEITPITPGQAGSSRDPSQRWRHKNEFPVLPEMDQTCSTGISAGSSEIPEVKTPFSYFERYLKDDFFEDMAEFSNRKYVLLKGRSLNTNGPEIRKYWGASIAAALVGFPKIRMCWDRRTRFPLIADNISRDRFYTLRNSLKIVDDNAVSDLKKEDRFWKVRPMLAREVKYAPLTSCDVERSFSQYKSLFRDNGHAFMMENLEMTFVVHCNSRSTTSTQVWLDHTFSVLSASWIVRSYMMPNYRRSYGWQHCFGVFTDINNNAYKNKEAREVRNVEERRATE
ncbi:hypothetical protein ANN_25849 [Periplaneta americana]|uniref:PiggyBac transposable element-derived protein domain-containing protein n=1 Tax=Periplaneta americana TaxID=6978 RepID=A0ABQ8S4R0_PERAM|nr:hypothetical protein ANN_25849 [Periplaneta americana]